MNIHSAGMSLTNQTRPSVAGHLVTISDGTGESEPFYASSPPVGHALLTEAGLSLDHHDRAFFYELDADERLLSEPPLRGYVITDQTDGSRWRIIPPDSATDAWKWHGQDRSAILVMTKKDD